MLLVLKWSKIIKLINNQMEFLDKLNEQKSI